MFYWIYDIDTPQLALLITGTFVGFFWVGCFLVRPILRTFVRARWGTNDIVGYVLSSFGVFYGLLLSLIAVVTYQNLTRAEKNVAREAVLLNPRPYWRYWVLVDNRREVDRRSRATF